MGGRSHAASVLGFLDEGANFLSFRNIVLVLIWLWWFFIVVPWTWNWSQFSFINNCFGRGNSVSFWKLALALQALLPVCEGVIFWSRYKLLWLCVSVDKMRDVVLRKFGRPRSPHQQASIWDIITLDAEYVIRVGVLHVWPYNFINRYGISIYKVHWRIIHSRIVSLLWLFWLSFGTAIQKCNLIWLLWVWLPNGADLIRMEPTFTN